MNPVLPGWKAILSPLSVVACIASAGCTTYTYNCNVRDACPTSTAAAPATPVAPPR